MILRGAARRRFAGMARSYGAAMCAIRVGAGHAREQAGLE